MSPVLGGKKGGCAGCGKRLARGVRGVSRAALAAVTGVGGVEPRVYHLRLAACAGCPSRVVRSNSCAECGCFLGPKAKLADEKCPRGAWPE